MIDMWAVIPPEKCSVSRVKQDSQPCICARAVTLIQTMRATALDDGASPTLTTCSRLLCAERVSHKGVLSGRFQRLPVCPRTSLSVSVIRPF